jgi:hypothetical protein
MLTMETIREQIQALTTSERTALENAIDIVYTYNSVTYTYSTGSEQINLLENLYGDWKTPNFTTTYLNYVLRNKDNLCKILSAFAVDLSAQIDEHTETVTDIAPATVKSYTTEPEHKETIKKAPFDTQTVKTDTETTSITNNGTEYMSNRGVTEYDTTKADGHTSKVVSDKTGTNYPISKIISEEIQRRFADYLTTFIEVYLHTQCYRVEVI